MQIATAGNTALALDSNNVLVRDTAGTKTATTLTKVTPNQTAVAMANYGLDVYLLDPVGNQIWRYAGAVSGYSPQPAGFLAPGGPSIRQAIAFTLNNQSLYVLLSSGKVLKFDSHGNLVPYKFTARLPLVRPNAIFTDVGLPYVWIADPGAHQIVQLGQSGKYFRTYVGTGKNANFANIKSIAVSPNDKWLYVTTGSKLLRLSVVP